MTYVNAMDCIFTKPTHPAEDLMDAKLEIPSEGTLIGGSPFHWRRLAALANWYRLVGR